jgi:uncharacterized protein (TIGR03084 family)
VDSNPLAVASSAPTSVSPVATLSELLHDLDDEYDDCRRLVEGLPADAPEWDRPTPAVGWAVRDQISHLAFFDEAGRQAMVEPEAFARSAVEAMAGTGDPMEVHLGRGRAMDGDGLLSWWDGAHRAMTAAFADADPTARLPWYGPPMGVLSFLTARLMETWAHGTDVADALGVERQPTDRLRHVAHLGVRTRPFSYLVRERDVPAGRIDVTRASPAGEQWSFVAGSSDGGEPVASVTGTALDFCLVVTQRRHVADTALVVAGVIASDWLSVAQAFAGPPGPGRPQGDG